jgi:hypothetical protein
MENKNVSADFATITSVHGDVMLKRADGSTSTLENGDRLIAGDVVITSANASLEIAVAGGSVLHLSKDVGEVLALDSTVFDAVGSVEDSSVSLDALNILLAHHSDIALSHDAHVALNFADIIADTEHDVFGSNKHHAELSASPNIASIEGGGAQPSLAVTHWNHIDS